MFFVLGGRFMQLPEECVLPTSQSEITDLEFTMSSYALSSLVLLIAPLSISQMGQPRLREFQ